MLSITILLKIHYIYYKCKTSKLNANRHSNTTQFMLFSKFVVNNWHVLYMSNENKIKLNKIKFNIVNLIL